MSRAKEFDGRMVKIYQRAKAEAGYPATRFLHMLEEHGGVQTAHILLASTTPSDGYTALWERGRLDLTVEALVLEQDWGLFSEVELARARRRLKDYGYFED
jgi:hypothetical protein